MGLVSPGPVRWRPCWDNVGEALAKMLSGAMNVRHGRAFGDLEDFGNLRVFHLFDRAKQQTGAGDVGDGVERLDYMIVKKGLVGRQFAVPTEAQGRLVGMARR